MRRLLPDPYTDAGNVRVISKPSYESRVTMTETVSPAHANVKGLAYAGTVMGWIDIAAGIAAKRHASTPSVTRSVDDVAFLHPVKVGDILTIQAAVNKSWKTSMEVGVKVEAESPLTGQRYFVAHAYLTFVALSPRPSPRTYFGRKLIEHHPIRVPEVIPYSVMDKRRFENAEERRRVRFSRKQPNHKPIQDLMREWALGHQREAIADAPIRPHPALNVLQHEEGDDERDQENVREIIRQKGRRFSKDPRMSLQPQEKRMSSTFAEVVELVMPQHANTLRITFGGQIMAWMEACAIASANRLVRAYLLTASVDSLNFISSSHVGDVITIRSCVSRSYNSSMEVYVTVEAENLQTGETKFTNDGFFTIAAIDEEFVPVKVPSAIPESEPEVKLCQGSHERRTTRLAQRTELMRMVNASAIVASPLQSPT
ncbi:Acyl-coenzyme A thioesterase 12 [Apophysomyces sp. BC1034]|nr:Acyl-coenzyme A thioesterase 12 [Apophysomyces sp. BC1015]KAG0172079.1 Acyl-coenzyme A thioesterase 12 [Apophysomyces sp. BC1021]KAG0185038.1 Acyl-coenzyme A thioesterase 12 [Apophysomyces sp. BC1034]